VSILVVGLAFYYGVLRASVTEAELAAVQKQLANASAEARVSRTTLEELQRDLASKLAKASFAEGTVAARNKRYKEALEHFTRAIGEDSSFAEAYRGRAQARISISPRDFNAELEDWALYYDLRPSLNLRTQLIMRIAEIKPVNDILLNDQLRKLAGDAANEESRDASPSQIARKLQAVADQFPEAVRPTLDTTVQSLLAVPEAPSASGKSAAAIPARSGGGEPAAKPAFTEVVPTQPGLGSTIRVEPAEALQVRTLVDSKTRAIQSLQGTPPPGAAPRSLQR
jgi:tetratricopeptide (TPR) repeat protein